jgi:hypothetical protein
MASEIKVDTISEKTSANGVSIDSVVHKDSAVYPSSADGGALGSASNEWSDLFLADSSVIKFGADQDTTLTHTDGTGLTLNSTNKLCFNDASQFVQGSSATVLSIGATDEIDLTATAVDLNGTLDVSGTSLLTGRVGVVTAGDLGSGIHIRTADSGAGVEGDADELVIEGSGNTGMSILAGSSSQANIFFGDSSDADVGRIYYNNSGDTMSFFVNAGERLRSGSLGQISTGDESAADVSSGGLCLNQSSYDTNVLTFKSSDVAHGVTTIEETDTYFSHKKYDGGTGGNKIIGFDENDSPFVFHAIFATGNTYKTSQGNGPFRVMCADINGTGVAVAPANANLFTISKNISGSNCVFIVDEDGDIYYDGSAAAFDEHDDAQLVRAYDQYRAPDAVIQGKFDKFVQYNRQSLIDAKLIGDCPIEEEMAGTNKPLVSLTGMQRLHNGAIWQQYEKHQQLLEAVYDLAKEAVGEEKANAILDKHEVKRLQ